MENEEFNFREELKKERERYMAKGNYNVEALTLLKRIEVDFDKLIKKLTGEIHSALDLPNITEKEGRVLEWVWSRIDKLAG